MTLMAILGCPLIVVVAWYEAMLHSIETTKAILSITWLCFVTVSRTVTNLSRVLIFDRKHTYSTKFHGEDCIIAKRFTYSGMIPYLIMVDKQTDKQKGGHQLDIHYVKLIMIIILCHMTYNILHKELTSMIIEPALIVWGYKAVMARKNDKGIFPFSYTLPLLATLYWIIVLLALVDM